MYAADFRAAARRALSGRWLLAVLAGLIAALLGGSSMGAPRLELNFNASELNFSLDGLKLAAPFGVSLPPALAAWLFSSVVLMVLCALALGLVLMAVGSVVSVGYARFNLNLVDGGEPQLGDLFAYVPWFKNALCTRLLKGIYIFLWSLLLLIPGIMACYDYAMTSYLLAEEPELTASQALRRSKELMAGNRWRLFCLQISFIGWSILCMFTFGLGSLFLNPYTQAATAAFYRDITGLGASGPCSL